MVKYVHEPVLQNEAAANEILMDIILPQYKNNLGRWAIYTNDNHELIGWCGLKLLAGTNEIDLGYRFMQQHWGKGYATEAAQHTLLYGLTELKIPEIAGKTHAENIASQKVLQKIGMQFVKDATEDGESIKIYIARQTIAL